MTTKRTHGPCTCTNYHPNAGHESSCPSLYPAQQDPDALTRMTRFLRSRVGHVLRDDETEQAIALISETNVAQRAAALESVRLALNLPPVPGSLARWARGKSREEVAEALERVATFPAQVR